MAEKLFTNVRLGLKIDTLENWKKSSLVLKKGEVAFATVAASEGLGLTDPVCMMKIGDGEHTFSELTFDFYAKASDVLSACKSEEALKTFISGVIAESGIATNDAMEALAGKVTAAEGKITALEGELNTAETGLKARMTAVEAKAALVGDKAVATQISEAIAELKIAEYAKKTEVEAVDTALSTYKTANDAAVKKVSDDLAAEISRAGLAEKANADAIALIKDSETIDSFADVVVELNKKEASGAAAQALVDAKAYADGLAGNYDAAGSAAAALKDAKDYADGLAGDYDAAGSAAQALEDAQGYTDAEIKEWVGEEKVAVQISAAIAAEDLANTYAAKVHKHAKDDITDFAHTHEMGEVNGLADEFAKYQLVGDYATKEEAQGYADAKDEAIAAALAAGQEADRKAVAAQGEVDALEEVVGALPEGETSVVAYIEKKTAGIATSAALEELQGAVDTLEGLVGEGEVTGRIAAAVAGEADLRTEADAVLEARIKAVEDDYLVEADKTELQNQITTNANAIERLTNGVSAEEVDGVNDLIQYVKDHGTEVTGMKKNISDNAAAIAAEKERAEGIEGGLETRLQAVEGAIGETGSVATAIEGAVTEAKGYADEKVQGLADGSVKANTEAIAALQEKVGTDTVPAQIAAAITAENLDQYATDEDLEGAIDRIEALEAIDHEHANKAELDKFVEGDKAKLDSALQTVTAGVGLKAVKTGTDVAIDLDETVTFIFDCGGADVE